MAVTVDKSKKIIIRFRVNGFSKQFYLNSGLKDSSKNRAIVDSRWEEIQREISLGIFDPTLDRYRFGVKDLAKIQNSELTMSELWEKFTEFKRPVLAPTTIHNYENTAKIISKLPTGEPFTLQNHLLKDYSYLMVRKIFSDLHRCHAWALRSGLITSNPFQGLKLSKPKKSSREDLAAYTLDQRDLIIEAFEHHPKFAHYAPLIKFLFWAGCRPGEAFALTWGDISPDATKITISKSYASRIRLVKGTKNGKRRIFPAAPGGKLQKLLLAMRPIQPQPSELVFKSVSGKQLNLRMMDKIWRGQHQNQKYCYPGVVGELAIKGLIPYLKLYSTRHTFATWAIASGASPDKVAYWLGDDVATVLAYYCHPEVSKSDCPDF